MTKKLPEVRRTSRPSAKAAPKSAASGAAKATKAAPKKPAAAKRSAAANSKPKTAPRAAKAKGSPSAAAAGAASGARISEEARASSSSSSAATGIGETMPAQAETIEVQAPVASAAVLQQRSEAKSIVAKYAAWSSAFGLMPVPYADIAGISGTQIAMVAALCKHYKVPFSKTWVRTILGAIVGGVAPWAVTRGVVSSFFKSIPGWGTAVGIAGMAGLTNLATRTIGNLFIEHFEAGGTLEDIDTAAMKEKLAEEMKKEG